MTLSPASLALLLGLIILSVIDRNIGKLHSKAPSGSPSPASRAMLVDFYGHSSIAVAASALAATLSLENGKLHQEAWFVTEVL